jgi:hypothetical protein
MNGNEISFKVYNKKHELVVTAAMGSLGELHGPSDRQLFQRVSESLDATVLVKFYRIKGSEKELLYQDEGFPAGAEANGKLEDLLDER